MVSAVPIAEPSPRALAPAWHTVVVVLVLLAVSWAGARSGNLPFVAQFGRAGAFAALIALEWALVAFIAWAGRRRGIGLRELVGGRWARPRDFFRDLGIGLAFLAGSQVVLAGLAYLLKPVPNQAMRNMIPQSPLDYVLFLLLSLTAGICEEAIFRGYLLRQFAAVSGTAGGILLQGALFGASHGYQGWRLMLMIAVYGSLFGLLARWRRSLRPGMLTHFIQDGVSGLLARHLMR